MANDSKQKSSLEQVQQQRLLPLQVRVGRMLEMNAIEVEEEVRRALEELPALEVSENDPHSRSDDTDTDEQPFNETAEEIQLADYRNDEEIPSILTHRNNYDPDNRFSEPVIASSDGSIIDTLTRQINELDVSALDKLIASYIIGNIDSNGYMSRDLTSITNDIAIHTGNDVTPEHVRRVWGIVRSLDPAGIGAIDLRDCLLLQLKRKPKSESVNDATEIIDDYFDLFAKKHFEKIASLMSLPENRMHNALALIRQLNPKPASQLDGGGIEDNARHIVPDFAVETDGDTITLTLLNNIPELCIEESFTDDFQTDGSINERQKRDAQTFIRQHRDEARDFIKILKTRQQTLFNVMSAIVKLQHDFFLTDDPGKIRPMILKDIAAITGYDLSVISRAAASKYVATAHGVYPLKMFFNERTQAEDDASSQQVIATIEKIINSEDKKHPLSDEQLTSELNKRGFSMARRTVAKYREKIGIPVARLRKEL